MPLYGLLGRLAKPANSQWAGIEPSTTSPPAPPNPCGLNAWMLLSGAHQTSGARCTPGLGHPITGHAHDPRVNGNWMGGNKGVHKLDYVYPFIEFFYGRHRSPCLDLSRVLQDCISSNANNWMNADGCCWEWSHLHWGLRLERHFSLCQCIVERRNFFMHQSILGVRQHEDFISMNTQGHSLHQWWLFLSNGLNCYKQEVRRKNGRQIVEN